MNRYLRRHPRLHALVWVSIGTALAWVSLSAIVQPLARLLDLPNVNRVPVSIALKATVDGRTVHVEGTTDIPDGAEVFIYAAKNRSEQYLSTASVRVVQGRFATDLDLSSWPPGPVEVEAWFGVFEEYDQPAHVIERYGSEGELMIGPQVYVDSPGDPKELWAQTTVVLEP
jgi:hypothetical protein